MTRGDRVRVNYGDVWPQCVCWPTGKTGTVLEVIGDKAIIRLDEFSNQNTTVELKDLEVLTMAEVTQYPIDDPEYMTPAQAAEARRMKAELPLWQQVTANVNVDGHAIDCASTEGASQVQTDVVEPANVSSGFSADTISAAKMLMSVLMDTPSDVTAQLLAGTDLHRALNGTTGMESEE